MRGIRWQGKHRSAQKLKLSLKWTPRTATRDQGRKGLGYNDTLILSFASQKSLD
jgi:hypothetical protein